MIFNVVPFGQHPLKAALEKFQYASDAQKRALIQCYFSEVLPEFGIEKTIMVLDRLLEMSDQWPLICYFYDIIEDRPRGKPEQYINIRNQDKLNLANIRGENGS